MSYAIRNDNQGWRAVNCKEDCTADEHYSDKQPEITRGNTRKVDLIAELVAIDAASARPLRAIAVGTATDADRARLAELDAKATKLRAELAAIR